MCSSIVVFKEEEGKENGADMSRFYSSSIPADRAVSRIDGIKVLSI